MPRSSTASAIVLLLCLATCGTVVGWGGDKWDGNRERGLETDVKGQGARVGMDAINERLRALHAKQGGRATTKQDVQRIAPRSVSALDDVPVTPPMPTHVAPHASRGSSATVGATRTGEPPPGPRPAEPSKGDREREWDQTTMYL